MTYILIAAILIFISSIRTITFAIWQFRNKNIVGGIAVFLLSIISPVLICFKF